MIITDKAQIKIAELREFNNLRLSGFDELECYELIESDLKLPADATFTRSSVAYLSDGTQVAANVPRFEQGKFGKAIMVEEGTTNYLPADIQTWSNYTLNASGYSITPVSTPYGNGVRLTGTSVERVGKTTSGNIALGTSYAVASVYFKPNVSNGILAIFWDTKDNTGSWQYGTFYSGKINLANYVPGQWYRLVCTADISPHTFASGGTGFKIWAEGTFDVEVAAPQLEAKPYATSFIDGTRSVETLTIPTAGVLNPQEGTVECWVMAQDLYVRRRDIFTVNEPVATQDRIILGYNVTGTGLELNWRPANAAQFFIRATDISPDTDWVHVGFRYKWNGTGYDLALIYNGQVVSAGIATDGQMTNFINAFLGCTKNGSIYTYFANMLFDDLRISNKARSDEEILAAYQNNVPLPVDEWTTYKLDFDDMVRITTQGQIICNELIEI